jgi:hypothetical protein
MDCGNCGREFRGERLSCLYCGWTKTEGLSAATAARPVAGSDEPRTFRAGATTWRFLMWALATTLAGYLVLRCARHHPGTAHASGAMGVSSALFVVGPLAFLAQLFRVLLVWVTVNPNSGLFMPRGRQIPWADIREVRYSGVRWVHDQALMHFLLDIIRSLTSRLPVGVMGLFRIALAAPIAALILIIAFVSGICLPVIFLFSPWQPRVILRLRDGQPVVWRDLTREADFVHYVEAGIRTAISIDPDPLARDS